MTKQLQLGSILILSTILLIVISGIGTAILSLAVVESKSIRSHSAYLNARTNARSAVDFGKSCLDSLAGWPFPEDVSGNPCGVVELDALSNITRNSHDDTWWTSNAKTVVNTAIQGNIQYIIEKIAINPSLLTRTYQIYGRGVFQNSEIIHREIYYFKAIAPDDPWEANRHGARCGSEFAGDGCAFGFCCSLTGWCGPAINDRGLEYCGADNQAQYVPPGWTCSEYFGASCTEPTAVYPPLE